MAEVSRTPPLLLYFPQWQGSGDENLIFHGAEALMDCLKNDPVGNFTSIKVLPGIQTEREKASRRKTSHWIRNYGTLSLYHREAVKAIATHSPERIFTLGGDCGIEFAPISYLNSLYGREMAVIWLDAHADLNTPLTSPSKTYHGMVLRSLIETFEIMPQGRGEFEDSPRSGFLTSTVPKRLHPEQVFLAGVRDLDPAEYEYITNQGIRCIKCEQLEMEQGKLLVNLLKRAGFRKVYIHIDADVLNLNDFNSVMCPTPGGIRLQTLKEIIKDIKNAYGDCTVGGSLVEVIKSNDNNVSYSGIAEVFTSLLR
jgi:arginase